MYQHMQASKSVQNVMSTLDASKDDVKNTTEKPWHQRSQNSSKMKTHHISDYPEVFEQAVLVKVLLGSIVKELKKRTNIDFEKH